MAYNSKFTGAQIDALLDASEAMQTSKEDVANKVTSIGADATDEQYPSVKAVWTPLSELKYDLEYTVNGMLVEFNNPSLTVGSKQLGKFYAKSGTIKYIAELNEAAEGKIYLKVKSSSDAVLLDLVFNVGDTKFEGNITLADSDDLSVSCSNWTTASSYPSINVKFSAESAIASKNDIKELKGFEQTFRAGISAGSNVLLNQFDTFANSTAEIKITTDSAVTENAYYYVYFGDTKVGTITQLSGTKEAESKILCAASGTYTIKRSYFVSGTLMTDLVIKVPSKIDNVYEAIPVDYTSVVSTGVDLKEGFQRNSVTVQSSNPFVGVFTKQSTNPNILQTIKLPAGTYQFIIKGKCLSKLDDSVEMSVNNNNLGIGYISIPLEAGKDFEFASNPATITEEKDGSFYASVLGSESGDLATLQIDRFGIVSVGTSKVPSTIISFIADTNKHIVGIDPRYYSGFYGKKLVTLGDSITAQESWQNYVMNGMAFGSCVNKGVGGLTLTDNGANGMCRDSYLSDIPNDAEVITLMGGTNDFAQSIALGDYNSTNKAEFCGALNYIIDYILEHFPKATLVVLSSPLGINWGLFPNTDGLRNNIGLSTLDYGICAQELCKRRGVHCIDLSRCGWTDKNISTFVKNDGADGYSAAYFHPNNLGGRRIGAVVCAGLKQIEPLDKNYI